MPLLTNNVAFIRTVIDGLTISSSSTFTSGSPATNVQHHRPKTFARSTDTSSGTPAFVTLDMNSNSILGAHRVYQVEASPETFTEITDEFNSTSTADCLPFPATEAAGDYISIGFPEPFKGLDLTFSTVGVGGTLDWFYSDGSGGWNALTENDLTVDFTQSNLVGWGMPSIWLPQSVNGTESLFYIKAQIATTYSTNPVISKGLVTFRQFDPENLTACPLYVSHDGVPGSLKWRLRFSFEAPMATPLYDSGTMNFEHPWADRNYAHAFVNPYDDDPTIAPSQFARFDFWAVDATYIDIGRIYLGKLFQPTVNVAYGSSTPAPREDPRRISGVLGQQFSSAGIPYTASAGTLQFSTELEAVQTFSVLAEYRGTNRDLVYIHDPKTTSYLQQQLIYGRFDTLAPMNIPRMNFWAMRYSFSSVR